MLKIPKIKWIPFDKNTPPKDLCPEVDYLIVLREDNYDNGATWTYHMDYATPYGDYIDDFWNTCHDWCEEQRVEVIAYAEFPYAMNESELVEAESNA